MRNLNQEHIFNKNLSWNIRKKELKKYKGVKVKNETPIFLNHLWFWSKGFKFSEITEEMKEKELEWAEQFSY